MSTLFLCCVVEMFDISDKNQSDPVRGWDEHLIHLSGTVRQHFTGVHFTSARVGCTVHLVLSADLTNFKLDSVQLRGAYPMDADLRGNSNSRPTRLISPNFLVMALLRVLKAAVVLCPAVDKVSEVFL